MGFDAAADFIDTHDGTAVLAGQGCLTVLGDTATMGRILSGMGRGKFGDRHQRPRGAKNAPWDAGV